MTPTGLRLGLAALGVLGCALGAAAQSGDAGVGRLIDQLRPSPQTRGIRVPGAEAPATPPPAVAPTPTAVTRPATPPAAIPPPRQTTAPAGVGAVSITVRFATGSAAITPDAAKQLTALGQALASEELRAFRFRIEGHTDTVGAADLNRALSEQRAAAVRAYLVQNFRIAPDRLEAVGLGASQLLVPTGDQVPEQRNRRVQVVNLGS